MKLLEDALVSWIWPDGEKRMLHLRSCWFCLCRSWNWRKFDVTVTATFPCSPCSLDCLHVIPSVMAGFHNLRSPVCHWNLHTFSLAQALETLHRPDIRAHPNTLHLVLFFDSLSDFEWCFHNTNYWWDERQCDLPLSPWKQIYITFFYISIHHIQHIYSSFLFLLEVNDRVAMRPPAEPIIGTRLFLNLPSPTFAALFPAPNVFVSFDLINHCWLILTKGLLSCVVAAEVDNQWNPTETQDQSRWHKTRDREGEGGTSTIKEKRGLLHHKTRWGGGDFKCTIQRGVDDHIYARCCNNTLLQFDHLRLVGKILNSLECLWHKILAPPPSCGSFNFLIHFSFL